MNISRERKIFISTVASVLVAALTLTYATYSWFNMQRSVSATGMNLTLTVPNSLEISTDNATWSSTVQVNIKDILAGTLENYDESKSFSLMPASSFAGFNNTLFQTTRALVNGQAPDGTVFENAKSAYLGKEGYEAHYVDVKLYFRTTDDTAKQLFLRKENSENVTEQGTYVFSPDGSNLYKIARFAFLSDDQTKNSNYVGDPDNAAKPLVYAGDSEDTIGGMIGRYVVTSPTEYKTQLPDYLKFENYDGGMVSTKAVLPLNAADYSTGDVVYHPSSLIVRIWIEGQDSNCMADVGGKTFNAGLEFYAKNS